jgi:hypothetical protein
VINARRVPDGYEVRNAGGTSITKVRLSGGSMLAEQLDPGASVVLRTSTSAGYVKYVDAASQPRRIPFQDW